MPSIVNTNVMSLNAQRNLSRSDNMLATSLERLSSGLRINSAKDDAAGLAIANRFTTQIRGLNQAVRNANDGISLAQTAESALDELTNNLQRIRELAVQSANATNSASDRAALDQEVQQRIDEINRIASQTSFNGQKVLDGSFGAAQFQIGANVGETITVNLTTGTRADQIGQIATGTATVNAGAFTDGAVTIEVGGGGAVAVGASVAGTQAGQDADSAFAKVNAINAAGISGLTATTTNAQTAAFGTIGEDGATDATVDLVINGEDIFTGFTLVAGSGETLTADEVAAQINLQSSRTGVSASVTGTDVTLTAADGRNITVAQTLGGGATGAGLGQTGTLYGDVTLSASENIVVDDAGDLLGFGAGPQSIAVDTNTLNSVDVLNVTNAENAIQRVDASLTTVSSLRSQLGAVQSRFESITANLQTVSENLQASRSRILDADFAAETANLTKAQILQQAGVAVLAQANAVPQTVLGLLR
ncbi:MAG: flagellin [Gammaproteobacteria bacterium]|nr:flagellin [Gammaproteobacteria bacterium]